MPVAAAMPMTTTAVPVTSAAMTSAAMAAACICGARRRDGYDKRYDCEEFPELGHRHASDVAPSSRQL
jgi:hypothetical protein